MSWDTELGADVVGFFVDAVSRHLQETAQRELGLRRLTDAQPGAVCVVQRWGGSVNLNPHLHAIVTDGVFVREHDGILIFRPLAEPTRGEIAAVAWAVCERVVALLRRRGQWLDVPAEDDALAEREPLLAQLYAASLTGTLAMGPRAGQRQLRLFGTAARDPRSGNGTMKNGYGFDVDASVRVPAHDRKRLEALARYTLRPPLSRSRLERQADGRYRIRLKKAWSDGSTHIVLEGLELLGRLAALVPPPRVHLTRYYGVFAPRSKLRREVVPKPADKEEVVNDCKQEHGPWQAENDREQQQRRQRRYSWSQLLARVFAIDVLRCDRCGSRMQRVEWLTQPARIRSLLAATGPPVGGQAAA
jgi:hypothetical protein